jgi:prevent-host-death family protein
MQREWQLQEAKAKFSELVESAMAGNTQIVTKRGKPAVVVISFAEYQRLQGGESAWDLFRSASRIDSDDLPFERSTEMVRAVDLS